MSLFRKLLRSQAPAPKRFGVPPHRDLPAWQPDSGIEVQLYEGSSPLEVVGESHYQDALWQLAGSVSRDDQVSVEIFAVLVPESDNQYDPNAVSVWINGLRIGYLSRQDAERYRPGLLSLQTKHGKHIALSGVIAGGGMRADGPGRLGVFLHHDPTDFGLPTPTRPPPPGSRRRTPRGAGPAPAWRS